MNDILMKLINGKNITDDDIANELYEICDRIHSTCSDECPIYKYAYNQSGCSCHKNGHKMLRILRGTPDREDVITFLNKQLTIVNSSLKAIAGTTKNSIIISFKDRFIESSIINLNDDFYNWLEEKLNTIGIETKNIKYNNVGSTFWW